MLFENIFGRESVTKRVQRAKNLETPKNELLKLACDSDAFVKICIAHRKDIDGEIIDVLVQDENTNVRFALVNSSTNGHIPTRCLNKLCEDEAEFIKQKAKEILAERLREGLFPSPYFYILGY